MRIVNSYSKHAGVIPSVFGVICLITTILLRFRWAGIWSIGLISAALILFCVGVMRRNTRIRANLDSCLLNSPIKRIERTFSGLTYNGKQLKHYCKVCLTHAPYPYADERKGTLWVHPEHFNADEDALAIWEENGGILSDETPTSETTL